jgi:hypothetical protein
VRSAPRSLAAVAVIGLLAVLLGIEVARLTVANRVAEDDPALAARLAPASPDVMTSSGMTEIGRAAVAGGNPDDATLRQFRSLAKWAPLTPEPFLVQAALAERAGDLRRATLLLKEARLRDPRSKPAVFLLADVAMRQNRVVDALTNIAILARLVPGGSMQLIPSLAQFARTPGAEQQLSGILRDNPKLKRPLLISLANDPANAALVISLAGDDAKSTDVESISWKARVVSGLVARGDYGRAYSIWRNFAGLPANDSPLLYNGDFRRTPAPPPFDWTYAAGSGGLAEPDSGRLHVLYYGREDFILAYQLLLLPEGSYQLRSPLSSTNVAQALSWVVTCAKSDTELLDSPIGGGILKFSVPDNCEAQTLKLVGLASDVPQDIDTQIGPVSLVKATP